MPTTITNNTPGDHTWVALATTADIECYGGGSGGATYDGTGRLGGGGGGGGGYATKHLTGLTIGASYSYHVASEDDDSWFIDTSTCKGAAGGTASGNTGGAGGTANVGDTTQNGHRGDDCVTDNTGGAGGSAGGPAGGGGGPGGVGSLGDGGDGDGPGGGGGGGAGDEPGGPGFGGHGAGGRVTITFTPAAVPSGIYYLKFAGGIG